MIASQRMLKMRIKFDVAIDIDTEYVNEDYSEPISMGNPPTIQEIIHNALEDIWTSHRFGTSMTAKNVVIEIEEYDSEENLKQVIEVGDVDKF
tara:strand:- start:201 stop:479 length:279 start_codon:yes stop_codon:yes gene_type:complete